jgi:hypothetical protein
MSVNLNHSLSSANQGGNFEVIDDVVKPNPYRFSPEQVASTKAILKAF